MVLFAPYVVRADRKRTLATALGVGVLGYGVLMLFKQGCIAAALGHHAPLYVGAWGGCSVLVVCSVVAKNTFFAREI